MLDELDPGGIRSYGTSLGGTSVSVGHSSAQLHRVSECVSVSRFSGPAGDAFRSWHGELQAQTSRFAEALDRVASFAPRVAQAVEDAQKAKKAEAKARDALKKAKSAVQHAKSALQTAQRTVEEAKAAVANWVPHGPNPVPPPGPTPGQVAAVTDAQRQLKTADHDLEQAQQSLRQAEHAFEDAEHHRTSITAQFATICRDAAGSLGVTLPSPPDPGVVVSDFAKVVGLVVASHDKLLTALSPKHPVKFADLVGTTGAGITANSLGLTGKALRNYNRALRGVREAIPIKPGQSLAQIERAGDDRASAFYWLKEIKNGELTEALKADGPFVWRLAIVGDGLTILDPDFKNPIAANVERSVAVANIATSGFASGDALIATLAGVNATTDWVPVIGEGVFLGSTILLSGAYVATHWKQTVDWVDHSVIDPEIEPIKDGVDTVETTERDLSKGDVLGAGETFVKGGAKAWWDTTTAPIKVVGNVVGGFAHDVGGLIP